MKTTRFSPLEHDVTHHERLRIDCYVDDLLDVSHRNRIFKHLITFGGVGKTYTMFPLNSQR